MKHNPKQQVGFTLVELLIVLTIIVVLAAIAVPSFQRSISQQATQKGASDIIDVFNQARSHAALNNKNLTMTINNKTFTVHYTSNTGTATLIQYELEDRLTISSNSPANLVVQPSGRIITPNTIVFRVCDSRFDGEAGYTVWINSFGISRSQSNKVSGIDTDNIGDSDC